MEVRAKATELRKHSTTYAASVALVRGASRTLPAMTYIVGDGSINRYTQSGSVDVAHLVSGRRQTHVEGGAVPGYIPTAVFEVIRSKPHWWTLEEDAWRRLENATDDLDTWLGRCGGFCLRNMRQLDDLAYLQWDHTNGRCSCFEHSKGDDPLHSISITRPQDTDAVIWLRTAVKTTDEVHIYAAQWSPPKQGEGIQFVPGIDGTAVWYDYFDSNIDISTTPHVLHSAMPLAAYRKSDCVDKCVVALSTEVVAISFDTALPEWDAAAGRCVCYSRGSDPLSYEYEYMLHRNPGGTRTFARVEFCSGMKDYSSRTVTWSKSTNKWCHGAPTFGGYILDASSVLYDPVDSREPIDVSCARRCQNDGGCSYAQAFVPTWTSMQNVRAFP